MSKIFTDSEGREWEVVDSYKGSSYKIIRPVKQEPPHKETASTSSISGIEADKELERILIKLIDEVTGGDGEPLLATEVVYKAFAKKQLLAWRDKHTGAAKYEVLEDLLKWHDKWLEMHDKPFNWFGAVKAMLVMKEPAAPFNTLEDGAKDEQNTNGA